jgi:putative transposase
LPRAAVYRKPAPVKDADLALMRLIDELHLEKPFYGARKIAVVLSRCGHSVGRKRVTRLMRVMGIETIYRKPNLSRRHPQHKIYPYLLRNIAITRIHQVWGCDITYSAPRPGCPGRHMSGMQEKGGSEEMPCPLL